MASKNSGKSEGAKHGRTELTGSPPVRLPTPGEARLGDWMQKIEETITAQASEIESLKATVEHLREGLGKELETTLRTGV